MKLFEKVRPFIVEFLAGSFTIFVFEMLADTFVNNDLVDKEQFISTLYRALRLGLFLRILLGGLEWLHNRRKVNMPNN
jgi:hypothetical protein